MAEAGLWRDKNTEGLRSVCDSGIHDHAFKVGDFVGTFRGSSGTSWKQTDFIFGNQRIATPFSTVSFIYWNA